MTDPAGIYRRLREALIEAYPDEWQVRQLIRDADFDAGDISFQGRARQTWDETLQICIRYRRIGELLTLALEDRPDNRDLGEAVAEWQALSPEDQAVTDRRPAISTIPSRPTIRQPVRDFTGRIDDIQILVAALRSHRDVVAIRGMGGIGKTELALVVARELAADYPDAGLIFELQPGNMPLSAEALLAQVIHAFRPEVKLSDDLRALQALYCSLLTGQRGLLLFDNVADTGQVRPLLPPPAGWGVLVTSRARFPLPGALLHDLELLSMEDAIALLCRILSDGGRHDLAATDLKSLAERCGRLPLALRVAADYLATYVDWSLSDYLAELERTTLELLTAPGEASVQAVLGMSVDRLRRRDAVLARQWAQLAVFPAPFDRAAAATVWGTLTETWAGTPDAWLVPIPLDETSTRLALSALVQQSLLDYDDQRATYSLHNLLQELASAAGDALNEARLRHAWHFLAVGFVANSRYQQGGQGITLGLRLYETAWPHLVAAWAWMHERIDYTARLWLCAYPAMMFALLSLRVTPRQQIPVLAVAARAAAALGNCLGEAEHLRALGNSYASLGEVERAVEFYEQALVIQKELRTVSAKLSTEWTAACRGEADTLGALGDAYADLKEVRQAIRFHEQAMAIYREIRLAAEEQSMDVTVFRRWEGDAYGRQGLAYFTLGEIRQAIKSYEQELTIAQEIGDRKGEGLALGNLGLAYEASGEIGRAIHFFEQELAIAQEIGHRKAEGNALFNLGTAYEALADHRRAADYYNQQLAIVREIGDRSGEGNALWGMGQACMELGERERARGLWTGALHIFEEIESPYAAKIRERLAG